MQLRSDRKVHTGVDIHVSNFTVVSRPTTADMQTCLGFVLPTCISLCIKQTSALSNSLSVSIKIRSAFST